MNLDEFLISPEQSARQRGPLDRIVMSSRTRLARNLAGMPFPGWAKKADRQRALELIQPAVENLPEMAEHFSAPMDALSSMEKQLLVERHLISREHAAKNAGSGLVLNKAETISVMINEEDHLRMQALAPGLQIRRTWELIDRVDSELEERLPYAFNPRLGYLTACPTNVGTGIRVSAMLHLPGLVFTEHMGKIIEAVSQLGLAVRGLYGEGTDASGNIFQVSNQITLGESETRIIGRLEKALHQIIEEEENARAVLWERNPKMLLNHIGRAFGILSNAHTISSKEAMNLLSLMRLGVDFGLFPDADSGLVNELFLLIQPAHLQKHVAGALTPEERDIIRADLLRNRLAHVSRPLSQPPPKDDTQGK